MNFNRICRCGNFTLPGVSKSYAPDLKIVPKHLDLQAYVDIEQKILSGTVSHRLQAHTDSVSDFKLDAVDLEILSVVDKDNNDLNWSYDGDEITLSWSDSFKKGEERTVVVTYQAQNPIGGLFFGGPTPELPDRGLWMCSDHETQRARYWLPCFDHSSARCTITVELTHNSRFVSVGPGRLESKEEHSNGTTTTKWVLDQLCPSYLLCIAVGEFTYWEGPSHNGKSIAAYAPKPCTEETLEKCFGPTTGLIEFMTEILGPLPWDKYHQLAFPGIGGAMENISLVTWDEFWMFDDVMHEDMGEIFDQINIHELAHTWFGNLIVCRDYAHVWLKESWATYMEVVWKERLLGIDSYHLELLNKRRFYFAEVKGAYSRPIMTRTFDSPWQMYDRHLYPGGAVRIHMLRMKLGDDLFWEGVRNYITKYSQKTVETDHFRHELEAVSGLSLAEFFDQWFKTAGYPKLDIESSYYNKNKVLRTKVTQKLVGAKDKDSFFKFPLEIAIETQENVWELHTLDISEEIAILRIQLKEEPLQVIIDPECKAVMEHDHKAKQTWKLRALSHSPYIHGRIKVAEELCREGRRSAIKAVQRAFEDEVFYGVRSKMAAALGSCHTQAAEDTIIELLKIETHSDALCELAKAAGKHRSERIAEALVELLEQDDLAYRARNAALHSLAKQRQFTRMDP